MHAACCCLGREAVEMMECLGRADDVPGTSRRRVLSSRRARGVELRAIHLLLILLLGKSVSP